ncbi:MULTISPECIES: hypothetical protein [Paenarthrobacter]|uniref:Uncharacterized protein n=1 Tax=Paenarthrobacter ureafaciens TaxID=37931 RepID=A0AAX3EEM1_PAEUR|nr:MULTISPECIES: hypothetical protein [Paenarthrobacter]NKR13246.1 hypothetical protein [Arthrobacter sp. M5]NKR14904.1 hypothetical protein [Arthrobacter sp. M6]OEH62456.1 hypothetical protein A5N13_02010 [Arthrobacter sp. D4]OEH63027.1 hypothetical protein A5N17_10250 [Arthrobacter sp. D2]MDO5865207.1 hypothetical protein [Paenarthrobacter sp. SD-2]
MTYIYISEPNFWWRADVGQIRKFVPVDPDVDDGRRRWPDRDEQRWDLIAQAVTQVSQALAAGEWEKDEDQGSHGLVRIDAEELTGTEKKIVQKWFSMDEPVRMDPWFEPIQNGRHRLWSTLDFFGSDPVPIKGDAIRLRKSGGYRGAGVQLAAPLREERRRARGCDLVRHRRPR